MVNKHMTVADIAAAVGCSEKSVRTALLPRGLKTMSGRRTTGVGLAAEMREGVKVPK